MPRRPREECESQIYHVVQRGVGQQMIFEDDDDRRFFLELLRKHLCDRSPSSLLAWCLMSNHTHLLIHRELSVLSKAMKLIGVSYARYFNDRYNRAGHLFQGRFASEPIKRDSQLMATIRYIHNNPVKANAANVDDYEWSSYQDYLDEERESLLDRDYVIDLFGSRSGFVRFHEVDDGGERHLDIPTERRNAFKLTEPEALDVAGDVLGAGRIGSLKAEAKPMRDDSIRQLRAAGLSARQIMRITGISLGVISRAFSGG